MRTTVIPVLIFIYSLASAVVMYAVEDGTKSRLMTTLEVVSVNSTHVIVNNTGNNTASMLTSTPSAIFTPPSIKPGETAVGRFNSSIHSHTTIRIESKEGSSVVHTYRED